ncbi:MAG TPA: 16S rRNA (guanine(527)-N(7))-methyltransferase RsmG [Kofleriaceae bacterium]|nr:16S rRNA (guanine(527)-N(7))-methyltransferase RsmG [Kofleriaceae bacterium]
MTQYVNLLDRLGIIPEASSALQRFELLFARWNQRINLSAARTPAEISEHVRDSLHVVPHLRDDARVIDVGAGGGFPVVIAAICLPQTQFVAIEPVHKKQAFLRTAARELGLSNLTSFAIRIEDHAIHDYDAATSRATFELETWLRTGLTLVRPGGRVLGFEGIRREDLQLDVERHPYELDGKQRAIVIARRPVGAT